jgi:hypothetical protein
MGGDEPPAVVDGVAAALGEAVGETARYQS